MKHKKTLFPILTLIIALTVLFIFILTRPRRQVIFGSGIIEVDRIEISTKVAGRISQIRCREGDDVKAGDTLVVIEHQELSAQDQAAKAGLQVAEQTIREVLARKNELEKNLIRARSLHATGDLPDKDLESIETQYEVLKTQESKAQAGLKAAQAQAMLAAVQLTNACIIAPRGGTVLNQNFEAGELVLPGAVIIEIGDLSSPWLKIYLPEKDLGRFKLGAKAMVKVDAFPAQPFLGQVVWISSQAEFTPRNIQVREERAQLVFAVKIAIDNHEGRLIPGMPADAEIPPDAHR